MDIKKTVQAAINKLLGRKDTDPVVKEDIPQIMEALAAQASQIAGRIEEYTVLKRDVDEIAMYLRLNYADEIAKGRHVGMTLPQVVTMYLSRERAMYQNKQESGSQGGGVQ